MNEVGCFGKVPAHGDFVWQALPARFVTPWDNWLQAQLLDLRERLGDQWLDTYLCGPIWRFLLQDENLGSSTWCGIVTPSVDVIGRYFPFTIATTLPRFTSLAHAPAVLDKWYLLAEATALQALSQSLSVEEVLTRLRNVPLPEISEYQQERAAGKYNWSGVAPQGESWSTSMLHTLLYSSFERPCLWATFDQEPALLHYQLTEGFSEFSGLFAR